MLFSSICMTTASNCCAAALSAPLGSVLALSRRSATPLTPSAKLSAGLAAAIMAVSDDFQLGAQRAGGLHGLQYREQILRRRAYRIQCLDDLRQGHASEHDQAARVLMDLDLRTLCLD